MQTTPRLVLTLLPALVVALSVGAVPAPAQELAGRREAVPLPDALAEPVRLQLAGDALVVSRGTGRIEFWWAQGLALEAQGPPEWRQVPAGALVGAMRLADPMPDIRGYTIAPGVYTLRFALQPQDGDHMGVSPYREFLIVAPASEDRTADPLGFDAAVDLGKKTQNRSHPAVLSIDPPSSNAAPATVVRTEDGHAAVIAAVPAAHEGQDAGALTFGVVLVGRIQY